MEYSNGDTVIVNHFGKNKVGTVTLKQKTVKGHRYIVKTEDTKVHEGLRVDSPDDESYIVSHLTKAFQNK